MAPIRFTGWRRDLVPDEVIAADGAAVAEALAAAFAALAQCAGSVLADRGAVRKRWP